MKKNKSLKGFLKFVWEKKVLVGALVFSSVLGTLTIPVWWMALAFYLIFVGVTIHTIWWYKNS